MFVLCASMMIPFATHAGFEGLNESFGDAGSVVFTHEEIGLPDHDPAIKAMKKQSDGKFVGAFYAAGGGNPYPSSLFRINADGTMDDSFGVDGAVTFLINSLVRVNDMVIQDDGKIIVVGAYGNDGNSRGAFMARFLANGDLDTDFGNHYEDLDATVHDGYALIPDEPYLFYAVTMLDDGKILVLGHNGGDSFLTRYTTDGELDMTYGTDGFVVYEDTHFRMMKEDGDGNLILVGNVNDDIQIARVSEDGIFDASFGVDGLVTLDVGTATYDTARAVALSPDGKIGVVGDYTLDEEDYLGYVAIFDDSGTLDNLISIDTEGDGDYVEGIIFDLEEKIIIGGTFGGSAGSLRAYDENGDLDTNFDDDGIIDFEVNTFGQWLFDLSDDVLTVAFMATTGDAIFAQYTLTENEPYVLTAIEPIPSRVRGSTATYTFSVSGEGEAQYVAEMCGGDSDGTFSSLGGDLNNQYVTLFNLRPGITYECQFAIESLAGYSNFLQIGPFTVIQPTSGGRASAQMLEKLGISLESAKDEVKPETQLCPADQLLTFPVNIKLLQTHLTRLGFNPGPIDGIRGPMTINAIKQAQTVWGTLADGIVGPITRGLINTSCVTKTQ